MLSEAEPLERNTSVLLSGDQTGWTPNSVSRCGGPPIAGTRKMPRARADQYAIHRPSGENAGERFWLPSLVSWSSRAAGSTDLTKISKLPDLSDAYATSVPSGENDAPMSSPTEFENCTG